MHDFDYQRRPKLTPNKKAESLREHGRPRDHIKVQERVQASLQMSSPSGASVVPLLARLCQWRAVRGRALKIQWRFAWHKLRFTWHGLLFIWHALYFIWGCCVLLGMGCVLFGRCCTLLGTAWDSDGLAVLCADPVASRAQAFHLLSEDAAER